MTPPVHPPAEASTGPPPVFLCGHRKSGTTLFRDLMDGHRDLAVYPVDLALLYAYFPAFLSTEPDPAARRARLRRILFEDLAARLADTQAAGDFDVAGLEAAFFDGLEDRDLAHPEVLIARLMAAFRRVRSGPRPRFDAIKETSIEIYASEIMGWFPEARFIQIMRDPRDNFAALAAGVDKHYARLGEDRKATLASLLQRAQLGFRFGRLNAEAFGSDRYLMLRFEDIVQDTEQVMRQVCAFLEIDFDPIVLTPTLLGFDAQGNTYENFRTRGVDARNIGRWRERIEPDEAKIIEFFMADEMAAFGYEPEFPAAARAAATAEFYKWFNYRYFYRDRFVPYGTVPDGSVRDRAGQEPAP